MSKNYKTIIENLGEDVNREGLQKTPERVAKAMQYLTHGYNLNPLEILKSALFTEDHQQMIIVKDIEIYSMCEHHMLPFFGKAHVFCGFSHFERNAITFWRFLTFLGLLDEFVTFSTVFGDV